MGFAGQIKRVESRSFPDDSGACIMVCMLLEQFVGRFYELLMKG